jgi:hypothetical protein
VQWYGDKKAGHLSNENKNHEGYIAEIIRVITKLDYLGIWMKVNTFTLQINQNLLNMI